MAIPGAPGLERRLVDRDTSLFKEIKYTIGMLVGSSCINVSNIWTLVDGDTNVYKRYDNYVRGGKCTIVVCCNLVDLFAEYRRVEPRYKSTR